MVAPILTAPKASRPVSSILPVADNVGRLRILMVNVYFIGEPGDSRNWVLVDAGLPKSARAIVRAAEERFGAGARPRAIVLTHGHFDHVGALTELCRLWPEVPIYAHELEIPYIKGKSSYPPPDPTTGGGLMARLSPLYPRGPYNFGEQVFALPSDGTIPALAGWSWLPTPGHSPGHVSLFRESDRTLLAGDAIVTTQQESLLAVISQRQELHGPPMYFTCDWQAAEESVQAIADLRPFVAATGHGVPMRGVRLRNALDRLESHFRELAMPRHGRYVDQPAQTDRDGVIALPPAVAGSPIPKILLGTAAVFVMAAVVNRLRPHERE